MNKIIKRIFSTCVAATAFTASINASAMFVSENGQIPESGILFYEDFENYDKTKYQSIYNAGVEELGNGNIVMSTKPAIKDGSASSGFYLNLNTLGYDKDYTTCIRDGQLLISQKVQVPSQTKDGDLIEYDDSKSSYAEYLMNFALTKDAKPGNYGSASWASKGAILYAVYYSNENPYITFNKTAANTVATKDNGHAVQIETDRWYNIECCIDYDNSTISYYCDGEYIGDYTGIDAKTVISDYYGLFQLQMSSQGTIAETEHPEIYFDDYSVQILKANTFDIDFSGYGNNYVDLKCNYSIDKDYIQKLRANSVSLFVGEHRFEATDYELIASDVIRFYFDTNIISNGIYNIVIGDKADRSTYIRSVYGDVYGSVEPGLEINFIPQEEVKTEKVSLIDLDFDDESDFAAEENSADFTKYTYVRNRTDEDYDFVADFENTYKYCTADDDFKGGKLLNLNSLVDADSDNSNIRAVRFPFADDKEIVGGTMEIDFDAGIYANEKAGSKQHMRLMFGLDNALTQETTYMFNNPDNRNEEKWSNSSCFCGLSYWASTQHALTYPKEEYRTRMSDWQRENNKVQTDNQVMLVADNTLHHYSIKIDISAKTYELSVDGGTKTEVGYLPGTETNVRYTAFVMTLMDPLLQKTATAKIDNLSVKVPGVKTPNVESVKFYDLENNELDYANTMTSKVSKIRLKFNQEVVADKRFVTIEGLDNEDYAVSYGLNDDGIESADILEVDLINCLNKDATYVFTLSADTLMAESGEMFGRDFTFSFKRGSDAGLNYIEPMYDADTNKVKAYVMNFTNSNIAGYVTIVGYATEDGVSKLCGGIKCNTFEIGSNQVLNVVSEDNKDIQSLISAGADEFAVYVFDGADSLKLNTYKIFKVNEEE